MVYSLNTEKNTYSIIYTFSIYLTYYQFNLFYQ